MRIKIKETQMSILIEYIQKDDVFCDNCGWRWKLSEGGDDPYVCHKCGHNNKKK